MYGNCTEIVTKYPKATSVDSCLKETWFEHESLGLVIGTATSNTWKISLLIVMAHPYTAFEDVVKSFFNYQEVPTRITVV